MKVELNRKNQEILIDLLFHRLNEIDIEMKNLSHKDKLEKVRLEKEAKDTLDTLKKFEVNEVK